jgi:hypothetical protein
MVRGIRAFPQLAYCLRFVEKPAEVGLSLPLLGGRGSVGGAKLEVF